jgi:hypothetical protein
MWLIGRLGMLGKARLNKVIMLTILLYGFLKSGVFVKNKLAS